MTDALPTEPGAGEGQTQQDSPDRFAPSVETMSAPLPADVAALVAYARGRLAHHKSEHPALEETCDRLATALSQQARQTRTEEAVEKEARAWLKTPYDTADTFAMDRQLGEAADIITRLLEHQARASVEDHVWTDMPTPPRPELHVHPRSAPSHTSSREVERLKATLALESDGGSTLYTLAKWAVDCADRLASVEEGGRPGGIYVASRASVLERGAMWRRHRDAGAPIISSWIDEDGPNDTADLDELWVRICREVTSAERFILYAETDDFPLKGAFVEIGMALSSGVPITIVAPGVEITGRNQRPFGSWIKHPLVSFADTVELALFPQHAGGER